MMKKIKIGIVGCGRIAQHYKIILQSGSVENFEVIAVCDKDVRKAEEYSKFYQCNFFDSISKMLEKNKPDLILVLTPSGEHFNNAKVSLSMNCNTIVEKPITMLPTEAEELKQIYIGLKQKFPHKQNLQNSFPQNEFVPSYFPQKY